jgi:hypothetical protein
LTEILALFSIFPSDLQHALNGIIEGNLGWLSGLLSKFLGKSGLILKILMPRIGSPPNDIIFTHFLQN